MTEGTERLRRLVFRELAVIVVLIVVVATLAVALLARGDAARARDEARAICQVAYTVATSPIPDSASSFGIAVAAGMRVAYGQAHCELGELPPPDPRVAEFIERGGR